MKKQTEHHLTMVGVFVLLSVVLFAYIRHETNTLHMNGDSYYVLGMIEQEDKDTGKKFYMPIYKRN